jgi:hypothetical protein
MAAPTTEKVSQSSEPVDGFKPYIPDKVHLPEFT